MRISAGVTTGELAQYITDHAVRTHMMRKAFLSGCRIHEAAA